MEALRAIRSRLFAILVCISSHPCTGGPNALDYP